MSNKTKQSIFTWLYRTFTYFVPGGVALWSFFIEKMIDKEVSTFDKIGISGIVVLAIMIIIAVFFYGKHLRKKITDITNQCIECTDNTKKAELVAQKKKYEARQEMFHNACFIAPFIIAWLLVSMIEKGVVSLRGTLMIVSTSMCVGLGFNGVAQGMKSKGIDNEENTNKTK